VSQSKHKPCNLTVTGVTVKYDDEPVHPEKKPYVSRRDTSISEGQPSNSLTSVSSAIRGGTMSCQNGDSRSKPIKLSMSANIEKYRLLRRVSLKRAISLLGALPLIGRGRRNY